ncbi:hypothetical protein LTR86_010730 [Recurvomyces mirabilis]|nr:hypothetical protein LTR86_010730 [Recurvomyces mirabilis]
MKDSQEGDFKTEEVRRRRHIICMDGTWNDAINSTAQATNVARIAQCMARQSLNERGEMYEQIVFYRSGVGNGTSKSGNVWDAMVGRGIDHTILDAYFAICRNYRQDDEIILIGYSRGAFAVRVLANFINDAGIMHQVSSRFILEYFATWQIEKKPPGSQSRRIWDCCDALHTSLWNEGKVYIGVRIKACAVWDTVSAMAFGNFSFIGEDVPHNVDTAIQALALHEKRLKFRPLLWRRPLNRKSPVRRRSSVSELNLKQCWFAGTHGDVGGMSENIGLANITLAWMIGQLCHSVAFDERAVDAIGATPFNHNAEFTGKIPFSLYEDKMTWTNSEDIRMKLEVPVSKMQSQTDVQTEIVDSAKLVSMFARSWGWRESQLPRNRQDASETVHWSVRELVKLRLIKDSGPLSGVDLSTLATESSQSRPEHTTEPNVGLADHAAEVVPGWEQMLLRQWALADIERILWKGYNPKFPGTLLSFADVVPVHAILISPEKFTINEAGRQGAAYVKLDPLGDLTLRSKPYLGLDPGSKKDLDDREQRKVGTSSGRNFTKSTPTLVGECIVVKPISEVRSYVRVRHRFYPD